MQVTDEMVQRFLGWTLPENFSPDGGITYTKSETHPNWRPVGTNLFTAEQARQMLEHVLAEPEPVKPPFWPNENTVVIDFGKVTNNGLLSSPESVLRDVLQQVQARDPGSVYGTCKKMVVIGLTTEGEMYSYASTNCGMHTSEIISLLEIVKTYFARQLS